MVIVDGGGVEYVDNEYKCEEQDDSVDPINVFDTVFEFLYAAHIVWFWFDVYSCFG